MADGFVLEVVTPERLLVDVRARSLVLRTSEGDMTVLDGHTSLVAAVEPGAVRVDPIEGDQITLAVHGGFLQVDTSPAEGGTGPGGLATRVTLLAGIAERAEEIDIERARRAREVAQAHLAEGGGPTRAPEELDQATEEILTVEALARAELRLEVTGATS